MHGTALSLHSANVPNVLSPPPISLRQLQYTHPRSLRARLARLRSAAFGALLRFEVGWHDRHSAGSITAALGTDAYLLRSATGPTLALNVQNCIGLLAGLAVAFSASWRITLIVLALAPLVAVGGALQVKVMTQSTDATKAAFSEAGEVAAEALGAPRTVAAYALQRAAAAAFARVRGSSELGERSEPPKRARASEASP